MCVISMSRVTKLGLDLGVRVRNRFRVLLCVRERIGGVADWWYSGLLAQRYIYIVAEHRHSVT